MAQRFDPETGLPVVITEPPAPVLPAGLTINVGEHGRPVNNDGSPMNELQLQQLADYVNSQRESARTEEKDKLYPELTQLRQTVGELQADRQARLDADAQAEADRVEQARVAEEAQMSQMELFNRREEEREARVRELETNLERERILRDKEAQFTALVGYRARRLAEEAQNIEPRLIDYVTGNTEADIEASIEAAKSKTTEITTEIQKSLGNQRRQVPLPVSGTPSFDTQGMGTQERELTVDELRDMDMDTYTAHRQQLLGATSQRVRDQGLYAN